MEKTTFPEVVSFSLNGSSELVAGNYVPMGAFALPTAFSSNVHAVGGMSVAMDPNTGLPVWVAQVLNFPTGVDPTSGPPLGFQSYMVGGIPMLWTGTVYAAQFGVALSDLAAGLSDAATDLSAVGAAVSLIHTGATYAPITAVANSADAVATSAALIGVQSSPQLWNGASFDRARAASAANQSAVTKTGALQMAAVGNWSQQNISAGGAVATTTKAAGGANTRHVITSITASITGLAAAISLNTSVTLSDGTTLWACRAVVDTTTFNRPQTTITLSGLNIVCAVNSAVTLAFAGTAANVFQSVAMTGYTVS